MTGKNDLLLTGASGFLGSHLIASLKESFNVITLGRTSIPGIKNITFDLANGEPPDLPKVSMVLHAAGKAHVVPKNKAEEEDFFKVNLEGTSKLLKGLSSGDNKPAVFIFISSVAVYGKEEGVDIDESMIPQAADSYGLSKLNAEKLIQEWGKREGVITGVLRLPLLIGKNAPGNFGAMVSAIKKGTYLNIGKGEARKSMLLASCVANVIPALSLKGGVYNLTDGYHPSFKELSQSVALVYGKKRVHSIPFSFAKVMAVVGDMVQNKMNIKAPLNSYSLRKMTTSLTFSDAKARKELNWRPIKVLEAIPQIV